MAVSTYYILVYLVMVFYKNLLVPVYSANTDIGTVLGSILNKSADEKSTVDYRDSSGPHAHRHGHKNPRIPELELGEQDNYDDLSVEILENLGLMSNDRVDTSDHKKGGVEKTTNLPAAHSLINKSDGKREPSEGLTTAGDIDTSVKRNTDALVYPDKQSPYKSVLRDVDELKSVKEGSKVMNGKVPVVTVSRHKKRGRWRNHRRHRIRIGRKLRNEIKSFYKKQNISYTIENGRLTSNPVFELLHNIEFLNTTQSILSLRHMQKKRLNRIYQVYMNNSLQLLKLESNLHHISADLTTEKDIKNLDTAVENYRNYVDKLRMTASKDIRDSLRDIDSQSARVMTSLAAHLNDTMEWKRYVSDQLRGVCEYLQVTEKQTLHDLKKVVRSKNWEIEKLKLEARMLREENRRLREEKSDGASLKRVIVEFQQNLINNQQTMASVTSQLHSMGTTVSEIGYAYQQVTFVWRLHAFDYDNTWTDCYGPRYVKLSGHDAGRGKYVGVVLCSPLRFKIFLGDDIHGKFLNIGDRHGNGEDHCEFVASREARFVSDSLGPTIEIEGYSRSRWGELAQRRKIGLIHGYRSPKWYDCGITIP